jgi:hypothetical protein
MRTTESSSLSKPPLIEALEGKAEVRTASRTAKIDRRDE